MSISDVQLDTFIKIYKEQFGEELERQAAYDQASKLINFVKLTCFERVPKRCIINEPNTGAHVFKNSECNEG